MKKVLLLLIGSFLTLLGMAQGYDISIKVDGLAPDDQLILANHFGDKQYARDTSETINGTFHFRGEQPLETGIYLVVLPTRSYFEMVISDKEDQNRYYIETDTTLNPEGFVVQGSKENEIFLGFNAFISSKIRESKVLEDAIAVAPDKQKESLEEELRQVRTNMQNRRGELAKAHPDLFIGKVYKAMEEVVVPDPPEGLTDAEKKTYGYFYYRNHYWDNVDLGEDGMVRTPFYHNKLKAYFDKFVPPIPDTTIMLADKLANEMEARGSKEQFKYTIHYLLKFYQEAKFMCFDKALHHITKNYYCNGRAFWSDSTFRQEMCEHSDKIGPTLCGLSAPDMNMPDSTFARRWRLSEVESPVTVLVFWDIDCGHCKKEMPILKAFYDSCNKEEVFMYAIYTQGNWQGWKDFIREKDLKFLNVANAFGEDEFRKHYNITTTPQIYVLDRQKKIIFKKIAAKDVPGAVEHVLGLESDQ